MGVFVTSVEGILSMLFCHAGFGTKPVIETKPLVKQSHKT